MFLTSLILSLIATLLCHCADKSKQSPLLTTSLITLLIALPLLQFLPKIHLGFLTALPQTELYSSNSGTDWTFILTAIWLTGVTFFTARLIYQTYYLRNELKRATPYTVDNLRQYTERISVRRAPSIKISSELQSPIICGILKPVILLPSHCKTWSAETLEMVILHELGHLKRRDLWSIGLANLCCALHWYNPFVWKLKRRFLNQCEFACDAEVLSAGADKKVYIHALCDVAQLASPNLSPALGMADKASLRNRVETMVQGATQPSRFLIIGLICVTSSSAIALSICRPTIKEQSSIPLKTHGQYQPSEIKMRLTANPFPAE